MSNETERRSRSSHTLEDVFIRAFGLRTDNPAIHEEIAMLQIERNRVLARYVRQYGMNVNTASITTGDQHFLAHLELSIIYLRRLQQPTYHLQGDPVDRLTQALTDRALESYRALRAPTENALRNIQYGQVSSTIKTITSALAGNYNSAPTRTTTCNRPAPATTATCLMEARRRAQNHNRSRSPLNDLSHPHEGYRQRPCLERGSLRSRVIVGPSPNLPSPTSSTPDSSSEETSQHPTTTRSMQSAAAVAHLAPIDNGLFRQIASQVSSSHSSRSARTPAPSSAMQQTQSSYGLSMPAPTNTPLTSESLQIDYAHSLPDYDHGRSGPRAQSGTEDDVRRVERWEHQEGRRRRPRVTGRGVGEARELHQQSFHQHRPKPATESCTEQDISQDLPPPYTGQEFHSLDPNSLHQELLPDASSAQQEQSSTPTPFPLQLSEALVQASSRRSAGTPAQALQQPKPTPLIHQGLDPALPSFAIGNTAIEPTRAIDWETVIRLSPSSNEGSPSRTNGRPISNFSDVRRPAHLNDQQSIPGHPGIAFARRP